MARKSANRKSKSWSPSGMGGGGSSGRGRGSGELSDYKQKRRAGRQGGKKGSCAPKLFVLMMPFAALGTYLFLRS